MNKRLLRKIHRWIGIVAGLQLLAWTISGLYFTLIPIEEIRGNHLLDLPPKTGPVLAEIELISPHFLVQLDEGLSDIPFSELELVTTLGEPVYLLNNQRYDATTGIKLAPVNDEAARQIVSERSSHEIESVEYVETVAIDAEYRSGELPAWRVKLAGSEDAVVYVGAVSGKIRAVRTDAWRLFDFLWSLHIMDYEAREDFNHLLIQFMAVIGVITVISGIALFVVTQRWKRLQLPSK